MTSRRSQGRPEPAAETSLAGAPRHRDRREDDPAGERDIHALIDEVKAGRLTPVRNRDQSGHRPIPWED